MAAGAFLLRAAPLQQLITTYLPIFFLITFIITFLLGLRFKLNRLVFTLFLLALSLGLCLLYPQQPNIYSILALLLPLNLTLTLLLPEKRFGSTLTALYGSSILVQGLSVFWLEQSWPENFSRILYQPLPFSLPIESQPGILLFGTLTTSTLLALLSFRRRPQPLESAFFWVLILTAISFNLQLDNQFIMLFFCLAILALLTGLLETSHNMAYLDELTGIPGRRALNESLKRLGKRYSLAMLDIDHFKKFNDKHGHDVGDQVLKMVAGCLATVTCGGHAFRYGGEEFTIVFPNRKIEDIQTELERIRQKVATAGFIPRSKDRPTKKPTKQTLKKTSYKPLSVTISIGVAVPSRELRSPDQVISAADQALYRAKQQGRNRICN